MTDAEPKGAEAEEKGGQTTVEMIEQLRVDMQASYDKLEKKLESGFTRLQWLFLGMLGGVVISILVFAQRLL